MNIKEAEIATINAAIANKTDLMSVTTADVADRFKELVALLGAILVNTDLTYNIGLIVYTASPFAVYVCKVDGATGDVTNQANWLKIAGSGLPYLVADTEVYISAITGASNSDYYIPYQIALATQAGTYFDLIITGTPNTNSGQLGYEVQIDTTGTIEGTSVIIQTDSKGIGMHKLVVDGTYNERLEAGSTYIFTRTTDVQDLDGYILTKIGSKGIKIVPVIAQTTTISTGKNIISPVSSVRLPKALGLGGETVEILLASAGTLTVTLADSGVDSIVNIGSLAYTRPEMKFTSDGVDKWYFS
jgi:hypothetical protein